MTESYRAMRVPAREVRKGDLLYCGGLGYDDEQRYRRVADVKPHTIRAPYDGSLPEMETVVLILEGVGRRPIYPLDTQVAIRRDVVSRVDLDNLHDIRAEMVRRQIREAERSALPCDCDTPVAERVMGRKVAHQMSCASQPIQRPIPTQGASMTTAVPVHVVKAAAEAIPMMENIHRAIARVCPDVAGPDDFHAMVFTGSVLRIGSGSDYEAVTVEFDHAAGCWAMFVEGAS